MLRSAVAASSSCSLSSSAKARCVLSTVTTRGAALCSQGHRRVLWAHSCVAELCLGSRGLSPPWLRRGMEAEGALPHEGLLPLRHVPGGCSSVGAPFRLRFPTDPTELHPSAHEAHLQLPDASQGGELRSFGAQPWVRAWRSRVNKWLGRLQRERSAASPTFPSLGSLLSPQQKLAGFSSPTFLSPLSALPTLLRALPQPHSSPQPHSNPPTPQQPLDPHSNPQPHSSSPAPTAAPQPPSSPLTPQQPAVLG